MIEELIKSIVTETVQQTLKELGALDQSKLNKPEIMTTKQLAEYLNMSESWIYSNLKELPHEKCGRNVRFSKKDIDQWRREQKEAKEGIKQKIVHVSNDRNNRGLYKVV
jgi:excisionase family DNA binding protein